MKNLKSDYKVEFRSVSIRKVIANKGEIFLN